MVILQIVSKNEGKQFLNKFRSLVLYYIVSFSALVTSHIQLALYRCEAEQKGVMSVMI